MFLFVLACDVDRNNPFDPNADNYVQPSQTVVNVSHITAPYAPIQGITITAEPINLYTETDINGNAYLQHEDVDSLVIQTYTDKYFNQSQTIRSPNSHNQFNFFLNAKPEVVSNQFYSSYYNSSSAANLTVTTLLNDLDGSDDISHVITRCPQYQFSDTLIQNLSNPFEYTSTFTIQQVDTNLTPGQAPELLFDIAISDQNNDSLNYGSFYISRIIDKKLYPLAPDNSTLNDTIVFKWDKIELDFPFSYTIDIFKIQVPVELVTTISDIPSTVSEYRLPLLENGYYYWQLKVFDQLGNSSNSVFLDFTYEK